MDKVGLGLHTVITEYGGMSFAKANRKNNAISTVYFIFVALLFVICFKETNGARILGLFPFPGTSHMILNTALPKELARRGHDVTVVSPFPQEQPIPNYKVILLKKYRPEDLMGMPALSNGTNLNHFVLLDANYIENIIMLWECGSAICNASLSEEPIQKLMNSNEHFDLIIMEAFYTDCFLGFAHKFQAPVVQVSTSGGTEIIGDLVGNPSPYAYVPDSNQEFSDRMTFRERLLNTLWQLFRKLMKKYYFIDQDQIMRNHFNDASMPSLEELEKSTALVLVNTHFSISYPRPLVPNFVQVGGMHVKLPKKLPADLQEYLDNASDGVIYFSMGSNLKSAEMPVEIVEIFIAAFSKFKQKVMWKWEADSLPRKPTNIMFGKWLPQSDILAHPNVRLFITHGGLLSIEETIDRGVPVIGIPIFGDQRLNVMRTVSLGFGQLLEFKNISEKSVTWAIKEVIENRKYRENAQRISKIYRDQPLTPMEQAVFWTEYVLRHKGAPHMRSAALDLTWYQYFLLDVIAVLTLALASVLLMAFLIIRVVYKFLFFV